MLGSIGSSFASVDRWLHDHRLEIGTVMCVLVVLLLVWDQSYAGRRDVAAAVVKGQRRACVRGMRDRFDDLEDWYGAYRRAIANAQRIHERADGPDWRAAATYYASLVDKMRRVDAEHSVVWPDPRVPGVRGPLRYPFGRGRFDCVRALPMPRVSFFHFG